MTVVLYKLCKVLKTLQKFKGESYLKTAIQSKVGLHLDHAGSVVPDAGIGLHLADS